jgi:hypothetical protein
MQVSIGPTYVGDMGNLDTAGNYSFVSLLGTKVCFKTVHLILPVIGAVVQD